MKRPDKIQNGRPPTAEMWNALIDYVKSLELQVGSGLEKHQSGSGTVISAGGDKGTIIELVTNVYYDEPSQTVMQTKRSFRLVSLDTDTSTDVIDIGTEVGGVVAGSVVSQAVVINEGYNTTTGVLSQTKRTLQVWSADAGTDATTTVDTAEECP